MKLDLSAEDVLRYSEPGPRYTSYPTHPVWNEKMGSQDLCDELASFTPETPLSIYIHLPFCEKLCHFCACHRIIDSSQAHHEAYLRDLEKEIGLLAKTLQKKGRIVQMHWGGGTPTFLSPQALDRLADLCHQTFFFEADAEISIEANPVVTRPEHLEVLEARGFNRLSLGVQDFNSEVQDLINRHQTFEQTKDLIDEARRLGFESINLDLVYGLPRQTPERFRSTLQQVIDLRPERLAVYSFAKVPWKHPFQRRFKDEDLPEGLDKVQLYLLARELLERAGYEAVGMDHFALPDDELCVAKKNKVLHRNFMGYTTKGEAQLLGLGVSAISGTQHLYTQNAKTLPAYHRGLEGDKFPVVLGHRLSEEDEIRRWVIRELMCNFEISYDRFEKLWKRSFLSHFSKALEEIKVFETEGLLNLNSKGIVVVGRGQVLVRNIVMHFDEYLPQDKKLRQFSNTI